ncbi:MAG: winged helix-turn-helix transcriptional regulator [Alphaproteobacteria bacterium]|nr:winged helix-turn-helix transcriptional regulator [Alphaproteobacteria bacterium]MBU1515457.1 winged helix-turn-helix transcriptional regulator [Alphaproteobacteria bacterium]MBU2095455.1 winged helix-turn-helix transcriptional regulator [Alphaproteobacteria bacterium]MBU2150697.1 winged helix-turn-helix transcriptional regulator [Alphaproteobacteria bacterium]MBU2306961.1 winged helix-turn-helix transcriptional regulator [Alphaproteobacteria bacterium]
MTRRDRVFAGLSFAFLLDEMANGVGGLDPLDALLTLAINQANIAPLTRDPEARARYGGLHAPAPDDERRPVSINAIAASLGLPFETARRRIRRLGAERVCVLSTDGVVVPSAFLASPSYLQSVMLGHERLRGFYVELRAAGLIEGMPSPTFDTDSVPVRAAARLLADYVLRASEGLMREAGNVISTLTLVALLAAALADEGRAGAAPRTLSVRSVAQKLRLSPETVRRHVSELMEDGLCARVSTGLMVTEDALARPGMRLLLAENAAAVQRLLSGLAERGVIRAWEAQES